MLKAITYSLPFAIGIAASPIPIIAIVVILSTRAGYAAGFLFGWMTGILAIGGLDFLLPGLDTAQNEPTVLSGWIRIVLGGLLLAFAIQKWRRRPEPGDTIETPGLLVRMENASASGIIAAGFAMSALNPKVIALTFAGAANIDASPATPLQQGAALVLSAIIASITVIVPTAVFALSSERARAQMPKFRDWLLRRNAVVSSAVLLLFGLLLAGNGVAIVIPQT